MLAISATDEWHKIHRGANIGLLEVSGVESGQSLSALTQRKRETEALLRQRCHGFTRQDFLALPVMAAYEQYYKRFHKTYHVLLQVESIVLKGKSLPDVSPLVDANFAAEVDTLVLTAGHDVAKLVAPVTIDTSHQGDSMTLMNGAAKVVYADDMMMRDAEGVCCTIIYGQDNRSPITAATTQALYVSYAPSGVPAELVELQLRKILENIRLFSPSVAVEQLRVLHAD